ncbi:M48 family metallopeptidase [Ideonella azotifigens]|uniref:M48 family metallopeptidase n=1 Tax=Ideonella azotifigens TaxID=513160 RepID=UPI0021750185|nr:SprT family zinc-dependent metalloprotease [Ideonella azotifigens]
MTRIAIHVEPDGRVLVDAPESASVADVLAAVKKRARWVSQHVAAAKARLAHVLPREYVSGESLHYLGRRYRLKVIVAAGATAEARMRGAFIAVSVPEHGDAATIRGALDAWYRQRARELFAVRLAAVAAPLRWVKQLPPTRLQFMTVQWGSCSPSGRITLNPLLVKTPRECIDYVLLHELCHLLHHNHSPKFYQALNRHMPNWQAVKEKLDNMAEEVFRT